MTKRLANVYPKMCTLDECKRAHKESRVGKTSRPEVIQVDENLG